MMKKRIKAGSLIENITRQKVVMPACALFRAELLLILSIIGLFFYPPDIVFAQRKTNSKIVFLQLRMKDNAITLVSLAVRPGYLKEQRTAGTAGDIIYDVSNNSDVSLWQGVIEDPTHRRLEYEDPDNPGKIVSKVIDQNDVNFTVRIPYDPVMKTVSFYYLNESVDKLKFRKPSSIPIGVIDLPTDKLEGGR